MRWPSCSPGSSPRSLCRAHLPLRRRADPFPGLDGLRDRVLQPDAAGLGHLGVDAAGVLPHPFVAGGNTDLLEDRPRVAPPHRRAAATARRRRHSPPSAVLLPWRPERILCARFGTQLRTRRTGQRVDPARAGPRRESRSPGWSTPRLVAAKLGASPVSDGRCAPRPRRLSRHTVARRCWPRTDTPGRGARALVFMPAGARIVGDLAAAGRSAIRRATAAAVESMAPRARR